MVALRFSVAAALLVAASAAEDNNNANLVEDAAAATASAPPAPVTFGFTPGYGDWMVLQQAPAKAAVYGPIEAAATGVQVTFSNTKTGEQHVIQAALNTTFQPVGYVQPNGDPYPVTASWKALLPPQPAGGDYQITAECTGCTQSPNNTITLSNLTFGDMWYCSGQSNMWLPVDHSFSRNDSVAAVKAGKYTNIRGIFAPSANTYLSGKQWMTAEQAVSDGTPDKPTYSLFQMGATCWYFAQRLSELGVTTPIGILDTAIGGQRIEEFMDNSTIGQCANRSGSNIPVWDGQLFAKLVVPFIDMTVKGWVWYQGENNCGATKGSYTNGKLGYSCEQATLVQGWRDVWSKTPGTTEPTAPFGVVTLASSGAEGADSEMGAMRIAQTAGYGVLPNDAMPNTFLAQAYDLDDQWGPALGPCFNEYQCCSKTGGPWPTPAPGPSPPDPHSPPNCSAAAASLWLNDTDFHTGQDLGSAPGDSPGSCCSQCSNATMLQKGCAYFTWVPGSSTSAATCWFKRSNGGQRKIKGAVSGGIRPPGPPLPPTKPKCNASLAQTCELACGAARNTPSAGGIHPRDKKPVGDRLGQAAFNQVYGGKGAATGPTLASCQVTDNKLTIDFDQKLLNGDKIVMQRYNGTSLSFFQVQTVATDFCLEPQSNISADGKTRIPYCPTWAGGDGKAAPAGAHLDGGWINLDMVAGPDGKSVVADLTPLNGTAPTAVRYAWSIVNCCDPTDPDLYVKYPCGPSSCPIMSSSNLPANPFLAKIEGGKCSCVPPQQC